MQGHDELLQAAVEAHKCYVQAMEEARLVRRAAFQEALRSTVTAREIAEMTGISPSMVAKIKAGQY
ncbi:Rrf2 family transcriptional regulator [Corynebacterium lizhenjunii]|uniref:Rrf2 family transcriptional regulator n=1 Tax=Corynebacterium lizhenjunii TaxID=2709394 RepID=UPI0013EA1A2F|nr:Rrf2 family transcriptional regulator [Corynebacterium lizhenjunii]